MRFRTPIVILLLATSACTDDSFARFEVSDVEQYPGCLDKVFPFEPYFLTARPRQESVGLLMQSEGGGFESSDVVYIEVFDTAGARNGETLELSIPGTVDARAIGEVEVAHSCPNFIEPMYITGSVRFDEFSLGQDEYVDGELIDASIRNRRNETLIAGTLTGSWRIKVVKGQPYEEFYQD
ncbi:MAG: hypothetical protein R3E66_10440 [bacterium]